MKVCSFCGTEMPDEANFCPYCGLRVDADGVTGEYYQNLYEKGIPNVPDDVGELVVPQIQPTMSEEDKKKQRRTLIITGIVTVVIVAFIGLAVAISTGREAKAEKELFYEPGKLFTQGDSQVYLNDTLDIKFTCPKDWDCKRNIEFETKTMGDIEFSAWYEDRIGTFVSYSWEYGEDAKEECQSWINFIKDEQNDMILEYVDVTVCGRPFTGYIRANGINIGSVEMQLYGDAPQGYVVNIDVFGKDKAECMEVLSHYE